MNDARPIILKIGGSAITDKTGEAQPKTEIINRLAEEIKRADLDNLIVVHGGGSFGHPTAARYGIKDGYKEDPTQKLRIRRNTPHDDRAKRLSYGRTDLA
jgi:isopentenyl phosphate kinase